MPTLDSVVTHIMALSPNNQSIFILAIENGVPEHHMKEYVNNPGILSSAVILSQEGSPVKLTLTQIISSNVFSLLSILLLQ